MITSLSGKEDRIRGLEAGCDDFLSKPINEVELKVRVRSLLKLKDYTDELAIKNLIFQKEIQLAGAVQQKILPQEVPQIDGFDVDFVYIPCFTVGGDFFYFKSFGPDKLMVSVFDVVGHGVQAALITMILKTLIDTEGASISDPGVFLSVINQQLISIIGGKLTYVTGAAVFFDLREGTVKHASAGHPPVFLCRGDDRVIELKGRGHILGLFEDAAFECVTTGINQGDHILLYTDGAFEAENEQLEIFGDIRLKKILLENSKLSSMEVNKEIINNIKSFMGEKEFSDDINLISVKIV
jgi:sigma-B regulation protein RsbU (phosphoserine phosphatase)